ncbi:MAG: class I tRNA ligase family protein [Parcubacteria group bacterium]|jgi:methionyl-tRNA synthetase
MNKFYITTPIYYVNAKPHIGHAYTTVAADVLVRFHKLQGEDVFFLTGTDEHGLNIQRKAEDAKKDPQAFVDENAAAFKEYWEKLDIKYDNFMRTTDEKHKAAVQKALQTLYDKGAIYKGEYEGYYCVACEQFKNEKDLVNGRCPDHDIIVEKVREECYLLKMSGDVQKNLIEKIKQDEFRIAPEKYKNEILSFLEGQELRDVSISRKNVSWGIPLPFDPEHTTYVWADAFLYYLTGIGWDGTSESSTLGFWPADTQLIGKDILRVHATIWPVMLMHLGIEFPKLLFVHGHLLSGGRKMSKTIGNVISIDEMLEKFGVDGTRYLLMSAGTFGEDVDVTMERLTEKYNADLANGLGNLLSRTVTLTEKLFNGSVPQSNLEKSKNIPLKRPYVLNTKTGQKEAAQFNYHMVGLFAEQVREIIEEDLKGIKLNEVINRVKDFIDFCNSLVDTYKPWDPKSSNIPKNMRAENNDVMYSLLESLRIIGLILKPLLPTTSKSIFVQLGISDALAQDFEWGGLKSGAKLGEKKVLFPRIK